MDFNPIKDEKKVFSLEEFITLAKEELDEYQEEWSGPNSNDFHDQPHTWDEWWNAFHRYISW